MRIKDWFYSKFDIEIAIEYNNKTLYLTLKSNDNGKRNIILDNNKNEIYDFINERYKEYLSNDYTYNEIINFFNCLKKDGFKLRIL